MECSKCGSRAVTHLRYSGMHLCPDHLSRFVERRVKKDLRRQLALDGPTRIAFGLSGGKDSSVALTLTHRLIGGRPDVEVIAVTIDEGIEGYRPPSIEAAAVLCDELGVEHRVARCADVFGHSMDQVVSADTNMIPCSYCGVFRRSLLNREARRMEADYLATGLNLDDTAQSILMNFARNDLERMARMGPHDRRQEGLVPRVQPLRSVPEKEVYLYATVNGIPFLDATCPYSDRAQRGLYREVLARMEGRFPGTRHALLGTVEALRPFLRKAHPRAALSPCRNCGEPTMGGECRACVLARRLEA